LAKIFHLAQRKAFSLSRGAVALERTVSREFSETLIRAENRDLRCNALFSRALRAAVAEPAPNRPKPADASLPQRGRLRINASDAVMRNASALRLRLNSDGGFGQLIVVIHEHALL
jgi:hypothetical protein